MRFWGKNATIVAALTLVLAPVSGAEEIATYQVYVANSGQGFDENVGQHNIAIFTVRADGGLTPVGDPVPTGVGARSLEFSPDGHFAYLVATEEDAVYAYAADDLTELAVVDTGGDAPFSLAVAPDGRSLYTANIDDGTVSAFRINEFGVPEPAGIVSTGQPDTRNVLVSRDGRFLFVSHGRPTDPDPDTLVVFPILPDGSLGQPRPPIAIGGGGSGMVQAGRFLYIACAGTNDVFAFRVGGNGMLTPVPGQPFPAPRTPEGVAITPDGTRLYVASVASQPVPNPAEAGVWTFAIGNNGALATLGPRTGSGLGPGIATTPDGRHLYTGDFFRDKVSAFDITAGLPEEIADSPYPSRGTGPGADALAVRPAHMPG